MRMLHHGSDPREPTAYKSAARPFAPGSANSPRNLSSAFWLPARKSSSRPYPAARPRDRQGQVAHAMGPAAPSLTVTARGGERQGKVGTRRWSPMDERGDEETTRSKLDNHRPIQ